MTKVARPIRLALFGGGPGAFIGAIHWRAAMLDRRFELVAGAFSRSASRSIGQGSSLGIEPQRCYASTEDLIAGEVGRPDGARAVAIATPNSSHFGIARACLQAGLHVICDKPMVTSIEEARALERIVDGSDRAFALTFTYSGYAMLREARAAVADGSIGQVRKVVVSYPQGWLSTPVEREQAGAAWRTDPNLAGNGGCIGDIGVHAFHLAEFVSGQEVERLCADLSSVVPGRTLDDDCNILLRFRNGAPGVLIASQVSLGEGNCLSIRVYGDKASIVWSHDRSDELHFLLPDNRREIRYAGSSAVGPAGKSSSRLPTGHPEGFIEAFANIYADFASAIDGHRELVDDRLPGVLAGLRSQVFIDCAVRSSMAGCWIKCQDTEE